MNLLESLAALKKARDAIDAAEAIRREKVGMALLHFADDARAVPSGELAAVVDRHLPLVLKASSQGSSIKALAKAFGAGDVLKSIIDRLENGE